MNITAIDRNLSFMLARAVGDKAAIAQKMLTETFADITDFSTMRVLAKAFVANDCRPLKRVPAPSTISPEKLSADLKHRFVEGCFMLGDNEALIVSGDTARGPYELSAAKSIAKQMSAASPTNDDQGHILDPEQAQPQPAVMIPSPGQF